MRSATRPAVLLCLCSLPILAKESPRFGVQVGLVSPQGDLRDAVDSKLGVTGGLHMTFDLGDGWMLRPRVDHLAFQERSDSTSYYEPYLEATFRDSYSTKVTGWCFGLDAQFFPGGQPRGFYLVGGLGLISWKAEVHASMTVTGLGGTSGSSMSESDSWSKSAFALGAGYQFNRTFSAEGRYVISKIGEEDASANTFQAVATFRF